MIVTQPLTTRDVSSHDLCFTAIMRRMIIIIMIVILTSILIFTIITIIYYDYYDYCCHY